MITVGFFWWMLNYVIFSVLSRVAQMLFPESAGGLSLAVIH